MNLTKRSTPRPTRLAFYGRIGLGGDPDEADICRQYHAVIPIVAQLGSLTHWFFDAPTIAIDGVTCPDMRLLESRLGPAHGGWRKLTATLASPGREFDAIVCARRDRLPRWPYAFHELLHAASRSAVPFVFADDALSLTRQIITNHQVFWRLGLMRPDWLMPR